MTLNLNNEEVTELQEETKTKDITNQDQGNTEILKKDLNIMKKSTDHSTTTDYNNRVLKIHFQDNVPTEKRKKVKGAILKENTEILIADMKSEYNVQTQKFDLVPCDIILSVKGAESLQDFKARLINLYKSEFNILSPCPCPGGERIVIMLKRGNGKEEVFNRKFMEQRQQNYGSRNQRQFRSFYNRLHRNIRRRKKNRKEFRRKT